MSPTPLGFKPKGKIDSPKLTSDCIEEILKNLDKSSLYSWTLINRSWCQVAISLLWSNPFTNMEFEDGVNDINNVNSCNINKIFIKKNKKININNYNNNNNNKKKSYDSNNEKGYLLIRTYISCLNDDSIQKLIDEGHKIIKSKTLFDYPAYLKELHIGNIQNSIGQWWEKTTDYMLKQKAHFQTVESLIFELLFNKCIGLKKLDCESQKFFCYNNADFTSFIGTQKAISRLNELRIDCSCVDHQGHLLNLLSTIINHSQLINNLIIIPSLDDNLSQKIPKLIESQNNLMNFSMISPLIGFFDPSRSASIFSSLTSQISSLTSLDFRKIFIDWNSLEILTKCFNLKSLKFINCYQENDIIISDNNNNNHNNDFNNNNFLKLNHFKNLLNLTLNNEKIDENFLSRKTIITIILMSKSNLKNLSLDFFNLDLLNLFNNNHLSNLNSLSIRTIPPLNEISCLSNSNISHLSLSDVSLDSSLFSITICQQIGKLLPINLLHLQLESRYNIAPESLTCILEHSISKLEILSLDVEKFDDTLLEVIGDYARESGKHLKELRISKDTRIEFDPKLRKKLLSVIPSINQNYEDPWPVLIERRDPLWRNIMDVSVGGDLYF